MNNRKLSRFMKVSAIFILGLVVGCLLLGFLSSNRIIDVNDKPRFRCTEIGKDDEVKEYDILRAPLGIPNTGYDVHADLMQVRTQDNVWEPDMAVSQGDSNLQLLLPGLVTNVVHYMWCERKIFEFQHYLSVLSVVRAINPDLIVFHYVHYPRYDTQLYNTWFEDMKKELPFIELKDLNSNKEVCATMKSQKDYITGLLHTQGGVYVHYNTIFMQFPMQYRRITIVDALTGMEGFLTMQSGVHYETTSTEIIKLQCPSADEFVKTIINQVATTICAIKKGPYYPRDAWNKDDIFSQRVNSLLYGSSKQPTATPSNSTMIPNIGHLIWIGGHEVDYLFYLNCLSQIYILQVDMLYIHVDKEPTGKYWQLVQKEGKVRLVTITMPNLVFRNTMHVVNHMADIHRVNILARYGGFYSDADVIWINQVPEALRRYDVVASYDWPIMYSDYPDYIQSGVMLGRPGARYWNYVLHSFKTFKDDMYGYNGLLKPYKILERHPDLVYVYDKLQVMCWELKCHPTWYPNFRNKSSDHRSYPDFNWRTAHAFHWTEPTPDELKSEKSLKLSNTIFAEIGRHVLEAAGQL